MKYDNFPLILLCLNKGIGTFFLSEINEEISLTNINIKYDFIIQPFNNVEEINSERNDYKPIYSIDPEVLDFTSTDSLTIEGYT